MLTLKSINSNLQYNFNIAFGNTKTDPRGHPLFVNIETELTRANKAFDVELRSFTFSDIEAKTILNDILTSNILASEITTDAPVKTDKGASFPFSTLQALGQSLTDDRTASIWISQLKLAHICSKGQFQYINADEV